MTEPTEPNEPDEAQPGVEATEPDRPSDEPPPLTEPPSEPVELPDESHSRTTELAARLRQSALAQVEAARAALKTDGGAAVAEPEAPTLPSTRREGSETPIPALDDPRPAPPPVATPPTEDSASEDEPATEDLPADDEPDPVVEPEAQPQSHEIPVAMSEPIAVAAAAIAESQAGASHSYLNGPSQGTAGRLGGRVGIATVVAAVLTVAAVVVALIFGHASSHNNSIAKARTAALAAAKPEVAAALTYSYKTLDADFAKAEQGMSTKFRANYARTAASTVTPLATQTHATSTGTVTAAGVISASSSKVSVLVFADQVSTNKNLGGKNRLDLSVIEVTMIKQGGRWVIDDLKPF